VSQLKGEAWRIQVDMTIDQKEGCITIEGLRDDLPPLKEKINDTLLSLTSGKICSCTSTLPFNDRTNKRLQLSFKINFIWHCMLSVIATTTLLFLIITYFNLKY